MDSENYEIALKKIGERIKQLRIEAGFTSHEAFADTYNIQRKQIWRLESGHNFYITTLLHILDIHNITFKEFVDGIEE